MKNLEISDLISIGVFSALYFVMVAIATFASAFLFGGYAYVLLPAFAALIAGSVYMLMVAKVHKFGAISMMGIVMGVYFFVSGHFVVSFAANIVFGILADFIAKAFDYKNKKGILLSYIVFSYGCTGPVLPMWFLQNQYKANLVARGKSAEYIAQMFANINPTTFIICIVSIFICAFVGGIFGQIMMKKHFVKAGIVD